MEKEDFHKLTTEKAFLKKLQSAVIISKQNEREFHEVFSFQGAALKNGERIEILYEDFNSQHWTRFTFDYIEFKKCSFKNIQFRTNNFWGCNFIECSFIECRLELCSIHETEFISCNFKNSRIEKCTFGDCSFIKNIFLNCREIYDTYFGGCYYDSNSFNTCQVSFCRFESAIIGEEMIHLIFSNSEITGTGFNSLSLAKTRFQNCVHSRNIFSNTVISKNTFDYLNKSEGSDFSFIDLHSLSLSDHILPAILDNIFGIKEHDIKTYSFGMTQDIKLQSVFISYSFLDRAFANRLNDSLRRKGVFTFLWEKNAPGGKRLKDIMSENINSYDRVIFIASQNSVKSQACQYELTQARLKQDRFWKTIFIPIHIDDYLFLLKKDEIRPVDKREEYWKNIEDLKEINSLDFRKYSLVAQNEEDEFESMVYKLISALRQN